MSLPSPPLVFEPHWQIQSTGIFRIYIALGLLLTRWLFLINLKPANIGRMNDSDHVRNIGMDIILSIITCGIFNIYLQYRQIAALNEMTQPHRYSFSMWLLLSIVTVGLYHLYHKYRMSEDIYRVKNGQAGSEPILHILIAAFGFVIVVDALQQVEINRYFGNDEI